MIGLNNKGLGLIVVLGIILLIFCLAAVSVVFTLSNYTLFTSYIDSSKAFYFADAGIQRALYKLKHDDLTSPENWDFCGQTVKITMTAVSGLADTYDIVSENSYKNKTKKISARISKGTPSVQLLEWQQLN